LQIPQCKCDVPHHRPRYAAVLVRFHLSNAKYFDRDLHDSAMIEGDPVDVALSWATTNEKEGEIPVISMANDKKPGGDWESST